MTAKWGHQRGAPVAARLLLAAALAVALAAGCSGGGGSATSFCESLRTGPDPVALFAAGGAAPDQMTAGIDRLRQLEAQAPSAVKSSLRELADVGTDLRDVLTARTQASAGAPPATAAPGDADRAAKASAAVTQYAAQTCAIDLGATTTSAPSTLVTPPSSG